jgi:hypothetical protein
LKVLAGRGAAGAPGVGAGAVWARAVPPRIRAETATRKIEAFMIRSRAFRRRNSAIAPPYDEYFNVETKFPLYRSWLQRADVSVKRWRMVK